MLYVDKAVSKLQNERRGVFIKTNTPFKENTNLAMF